MSTSSSKRVLKIGSRESKLALIQVDYLISLLKEENPDLECEKVTMTTPGDRDLSQPLVKMNQSALWTKELENSLQSGRVDLLVHSLKDVASTLPDDLVLGCIIKRANPCDAIAMNPKNHGHTLATLPNGSVIGTSSLRRAAQIKRSYPHLQIYDIRGNIDGRMKKLDESGQYDGLCLAVAALERMGPEYEKRISQILTPEECMYCASQAALAVECRSDDTKVLDLLQPLHDRDTAVRVVAERAYERILMGSCGEPIGAHSILDGDVLTLKGGVFSADGKEAVLDEMTVNLPSASSDTQKDQSAFRSHYSNIVPGKNNNPETFQAAEKLGLELAERMMKQGAGEILAKVRSDVSTPSGATNGHLANKE